MSMLKVEKTFNIPRFYLKLKFIRSSMGILKAVILVVSECIIQNKALSSIFISEACAKWDKTGSGTDEMQDRWRKNKGRDQRKLCLWNFTSALKQTNENWLGVFHSNGSYFWNTQEHGKCISNQSKMFESCFRDKRIVRIYLSRGTPWPLLKTVFAFDNKVSWSAAYRG